MLTYAMLFAVGKCIDVPTWFWTCWSIGVLITFLRLLSLVYKLGAKK